MRETVAIWVTDLRRISNGRGVERPLCQLFNPMPSKMWSALTPDVLQLICRVPDAGARLAWARPNGHREPRRTLVDGGLNFCRGSVRKLRL